MKIPPHTKQPRFYVATNNPLIQHQAIASWKSLDEAVACVLRWKAKAEVEPHYYQLEYQSITEIIETGPSDWISHSL